MHDRDNLTQVCRSGAGPFHDHGVDVDLAAVWFLTGNAISQRFPEMAHKCATVPANGVYIRLLDLAKEPRKNNICI